MTNEPEKLETRTPRVRKRKKKTTIDSAKPRKRRKKVQKTAEETVQGDRSVLEDVQAHYEPEVVATRDGEGTSEPPTQVNVSKTPHNPLADDLLGPKSTKMVGDFADSTVEDAEDRVNVLRALSNAGTIGATPGQSLADTLLDAPAAEQITVQVEPVLAVPPTAPGPDVSLSDEAIERLSFIQSNPNCTIPEFNIVFELGRGAKRYLEDMEEQGLVDRSWKGGSGRYTLTASGQSLLG